jgi:hypothetical protein
MKKLMLMACGICFVLAQSKVSAQEKATFRNYPFGKETDYHIGPIESKQMYYYDTLVIHLQNNDKILFIGRKMEHMLRFQKADSLKMLFLNDFEKALSDHSLTKEVQTVHYFVHGSGKRRLKAENPEYSDDKKVDVDYEIKRLNLFLPQYQYFIHDLSSGYELQIYINDPEQLRNTLTGVHLNNVIHSEVLNKNIKYSVRSCYKIEITTDDDNYKISRMIGAPRGNISISTDFGIGVFGNTIAPIFGPSFQHRWLDKYNVGKYKAELCIYYFPLVNMNSGKVTGVSMVSSYDLRLMINPEIRSHRENWLGLQGGFMKSKGEPSCFNNAFKWGLVVERPGIGSFAVEEIYWNKYRDRFYALTWKFSI